jgi:hypothetical protein
LLVLRRKNFKLQLPSMQLLLLLLEVSYERS